MVYIFIYGFACRFSCIFLVTSFKISKFKGLSEKKSTSTENFGGRGADAPTFPPIPALLWRACKLNRPKNFVLM